MMYTKIRKVAVTIFIICVVLLTLAAVLAIWDVVGEDVLWKSISTIAVLGFAALITVGAAKFMEDRRENHKPLGTDER